MSNAKTSTKQIDITDGKELTKILAILKDVAGVDFTYYKQNTIKRRLQRRLTMHKLTSLEAYVAYLHNNPDEADFLYTDLLINVTNFFRDPEVFYALKTKVFPQIVRNKSQEDPIRIWVAGCATGEEVYSIAMSLLEYLKGPTRDIPIQIFGTDISEEAIEKARMGIYKKDIEADISPERLERFFTRINNNEYQINKTLREICIFAKQNIVNDPPFSNLDFISCRNLLIYLEPFLQKRLMPLFHYALKQHGYLLLGNSESIGEFSNLFHVEDKKNKIYSKKPTISKQHFSFYGLSKPIGTVKRGKKLMAEEELTRLVNIQQEVDKVIMNKYAPSGVVVNNNLDIIQFRGHTSQYLEPSPGKASLNLLKMAKEGLFLVINSAVKQARAEGKTVKKESMQFVENGKTKFVTIEVTPIKAIDHEPTFLILFEGGNVQKHKSAKTESIPAGNGEVQTDQTLHLKQELTATREYLQSAIQELESTNEELQVANEEILSNNEELQSVNEELETSKEELQSANEELNTLNEELQLRNDEINHMNNDLNNLLVSVNIPIIMLDNELYIRRFTPGAEKVMNLIPSDIGRPIGNIRPNIIVTDLEAFLFDAIHRNIVKELEIQDKQGRWYLMRVLPYKTGEGKTEGAIMTFIDIHEIKQTEIELAKAAAIVDSSEDAIISKDLDGRIMSWNKGAEHLYGYTEEEMLGKSIAMLIPPTKKNDFPLIMKRLQEGKKIEHYETQRKTKDGRIIDVAITVSPLKDAHGTIIGASKIARDITEKKRTEENLKFLSHASELLSSSLDYNKTLTTIAQLAVPQIADWCTIDMLTKAGEPELLVVAHKDPEKVAWGEQLREESPIDMDAPTGLGNVIKTGKPEFYPLITDEMLAASAKSQKELKLWRSIGFTSVIIVPLRSGDKTIGAITFVTTESRKRYTESDLHMAEELARRASLAIENADLYQEAQDAIRMRDEFIALASHELKTPVTSLKIFMHALQHQLRKQLTEDIADHPFKKMDDQVGKLTQLINDLLNVSQLRRGKLNFAMEKFDLNQVLKETIEQAQQISKAHQIILKGKIDKKLYGDKNRISQVIMNLLTNAIKYSPAAEKISLHVGSKEDAVVIRVEDNGIGIEKEHQKKIFDQYYRVTSFEEQTYPGLGMGLFIAAEIVKRHGGKIWVEGEKGKGSTFSVSLPYLQPHQ